VGAKIKGWDVEDSSLELVSGRDDSGMGGVSLERRDRRKDCRVFKKGSVGGETQERCDLAFTNRSPNLLSVKFEEIVLVRVDRRRVLYARWRKIWIERCLSKFHKGGANVLLI
jgi:hypothetical protein